MDVKNIVDAEISINKTIFDALKIYGSVMQNEFKFTDIFSWVNHQDFNDDTKVDLIDKILISVANHGGSFIVSHAFCAAAKLNKLNFPSYGPSDFIQSMANMNIRLYIEEITNTEPTQIVVDLGLNESFKKIYEMYSGALKSVPMLKCLGVTDSNIYIPNFRNLPIPLYLRSEDSRLLQISDVVIGSIVSEQTNSITDFKTKIINTVKRHSHITKIHSVEWNKH